MATTNNWVKEGLDSYLALTGEHRAEEKAKSDAAYQAQSMQLQQNQDVRSAAAAGLTNALTQQHIDKGARDAEDESKWDNLLFDEGYKKEVANPFTPTAETIADPAKVDMSKYVYGNNIKTAAFARETVAAKGNVSIPFAQLPTIAPAFVQDTAKHIFVGAAAKRAGQDSIDPITGAKGVITGNMGHINLDKGPDGEVYLSADMEVKNEDGSIRYAPFTNRTDDPTQPVKRVPLAALEHEANSVLQGIDDAQKTGADPAATITRRKLAGMENWPKELKKKYYEGLLEEDKNLRTRESDVETTKKVGATLESLKGEISALPWGTDPHGATADLYTTLSKSGMTTNEVDKALKIVVSAKVPAAKNLEIKEIGAGGNNVTMAIISADGKTTPIGKPYPKHATPAAGAADKELLLTKRDISTRLREAQRGYQAAVKKGNPDAIAEAVDFIEALNTDAKTYGVAPLPVPPRPMTSDEETALYEQATNNVRGNQGRVAKAIGLDPNKQDIEAEFQRLKSAKPKAARPSGADMSPSDTLHSTPKKQQTAPRPQTTSRNQGTLNGAPPAAQHTGRIIKDTATGKRYQSDGAAWKEVVR
jgi:hypothetical protein